MMTWYWFIIILLSIVIVVGIFVIDNLLNQINQFEVHIEKITKSQSKLEKEVEKYYKYFLELFTEAYTQIQRVDKRGSFSSDDEVGFSFKVIYRAIEDVTNKLKNMQLENPVEGKIPEK